MADPWYEDEAGEEETDVSLKAYDITASPNDFNVRTIFDFIDSRVVLIPGFQRHYVWDIKRASRLIESLIIGIPIPQVFLFEEGKNKFLVVDGQQRLLSIYYFIKQRFPRMDRRTQLRRLLETSASVPDEILHDDQYFSPFKLALPSDRPPTTNPLDGLKYSTLGDWKTSLDLRTIRNVIIKQSSPDDGNSSVYEIFNRLNSGGVNLWPQEIRSSLYHSKFFEMVHRLNAEDRWRKLIGLADLDLHLKDAEFILRAFALLIDRKNYKAPMVKFLNGFSYAAKTYDENRVSYLESLFRSFLTACDGLDPKAFRGATGKFTISIFDAVFAAACSDSLAGNTLLTNKLDAARLETLKGDAGFSSASQSRTTGKGNVETRISRAKAVLFPS